MRTHLLLAICLASACAAEPPAAAPQESALSYDDGAAAGRQLFERPFPGTNGRSCATCHVLEDHATLTPANVAARDADDPLFNRIDADDVTAATPTYDHLGKGLVRIVLTLPDNMDVIDEHGAVVTAPDRKVFVWRAVPTIENTALTGPYQYDGREPTLEAQAQAAIRVHSEGGRVDRRRLGKIARFEEATFSSFRARFVSRLLELGVSEEQIPIPEDYLDLTADEEGGRQVFRTACAACHGGPRGSTIVDRATHDLLFFTPGPDGNLLYTTAGGRPVPVLASRPDDEFLNVGFAFLSYLGQFAHFPGVFNASVPLPRYRFRFYSDGTRRKQVTDLPPVPVTASGDPMDLRAAKDARGALIAGPNFSPQLFTTDPGRALITGDPADFEAFDVPQLRGIAHTAPYMHDNSMATLEDVVDVYSRFVLGNIPTLHLPPVNPPEFPHGPPETLTPVQKRQLVAFLRRL